MASEPKIPGISAVTVTGFKSLRDETRVEIRPLTLLAGANSSGKSSIMQPLLLLKQTLEASFDPGAVLLNGPNVRFTSAEQTLTQRFNRFIASQFSLEVEDTSGFAARHVYAMRNVGELIPIESDYRNRNYRYSLTTALGHDELQTRLRPSSEFLRSEVARASSEILLWRIISSRGFLLPQLELQTDNGPEDVTWPQVVPLNEEILTLIDSIAAIMHLPGLRGNPERYYRRTAVGTRFPGTFPDYAASVIADWQDGKTHLMRLLTENLGHLGLTGEVSAHRINGAEVEIRVARTVRTTDRPDNVSIADVGFGVSQTLPVLVALLAAKPGQLVYLEEPEIHLHPRAQVALADVLVEAANRGVRVVAETHSSLLLLAVQTAVAEGRLSKDDLALHWFTRDDEGFSHVTTADVDDAGTFGDWPEDFAAVELKEQTRYMDAAERRMGIV